MLFTYECITVLLYIFCHQYFLVLVINIFSIIVCLRYRHEQLEHEDHEVVNVNVETNEDELGLRLLNTITLLDQLSVEGKTEDRERGEL